MDVPPVETGERKRRGGAVLIGSESTTSDSYGEADTSSKSPSGTSQNEDSWKGCHQPLKRSKKIVVTDSLSAPGDDLFGFPVLASSPKFDLTVDSLEECEAYCQKLRCTSVDGRSVIVRLMGLWSGTRVQIGCSLRIFNPVLLDNEEYLVNSDEGIVIVDGDVLVPCTTIVQGVYCTRKAVLCDRFRGGNVPNKAMLVGNIVHCLFQTALRRQPQLLTRDWLLAVWRCDYRNAVLDQLIALNITPVQMEEELTVYLDMIVEWVETHMPSPRGRNEPLPTGSLIESIADIEENIWDPLIGIKGKVDVSVKVRTRSGKEAIEPLELKTGKSGANVEHAGQVLLYCLALSSKNTNSGWIGEGSLLYLKDGTTSRVTPKAVDLKGILHLRNELATFFGALSEDAFPAALRETRLCSKCDQALTCSLLQRTVEASRVVSPSMEELCAVLTSHLSQEHLNYFQKWVRWIFLEWNAAKAMKVDLKNMWKLDPSQREANGHCLTGLSVKVMDTTADRIFVELVRSGGLLQAVFEKGDLAVVSTEHNLALAMGSVVDISDKSVKLLLNNGSAKITPGGKFTLDKYESFSIFSTNLNNIALLMDPDAHMSKIRSLVVDLKAPSFAKMPKSEILKIKDFVRSLNSDQARAVVKSLMAEDYLCIQGLPGSGKTSTIAVLVRCLVAVGRSVLIASHTHSAVDNVLLKLSEYLRSDDILRVGGSSSMFPEVRKLTLDAKLADVTDPEEKYSRTLAIFKDTPVIASTCLGVASNVLFSYRRFSATVVDEASLALESSLIPSISISDSFILVGDSLQLCPLVQSRKARDEGMAVSLIERLKRHEAATITLRTQYRMNRFIANLSSSLFYEGKLKCADDVIANGRLDQLSTENLNSPSLSDALAVSASDIVECSVVFIDTQAIEKPKYQLSTGCSPGAIYNSGEIEIVAQLCSLFLKLGVCGGDIGVISVYRYHADLLRRVVSEEIEVNTVDQYQGRDKRVVIVSLVWTEGTKSKKSELLSDARRINVAITRAKHKLVLVGCKSSMKRYSTMAKLIDLLEESQAKVVVWKSD